MDMGKEISEDMLARFKEMGGVGFGNKGALRQLQKTLLPDETIKSVINGQNKGKSVVIAVTDKRLLFAFNLLGTHETKDIPLSRITSINAGRDLVFGRLSVDSGGDVTVFDHMSWKHAQEFANILRQAKNDLSDHRETPSQTPSAAGQLLKLKQLLDAGVLTTEEYEAKARPLKDSL